ncbi:phosphoglycerate kinase [Breznakia sp. PF5-3]|uniref:phosphoglycerate kinase n=1 Tax=unclassified Breznakia TaxID=2623764 RepID=UPI0024076222|nr:MULTISPECIES: phosphoglycerate kinase [unclassified Breznakia]MDF9824582.1 phosphoglycerate kinase [Breznakia sp. PM6-1]MDF9835472.1 phosphoglycerate kinase [Breznakia sp. PF5-3]MDF9837882.1 phosphoglycerate kinase [Breznakia sp. PFB2-8]MDF9859825.1 phosphoglycerate kinase [Breznakia sp. PH5-24]
MAKRTVKDLDVAGKRVICRVDFNVPRKDGVITNDNRIVQALPTINYLIENNAKIILMSHLGKIKTEEDKAKNNMDVVAKALAEKVNTKVTFSNATRGKELEDAVANLKDGEIVVVQNTRYEPGETKNDPELSKYWASLGDLFVEDAFGSVHRAHASTVGIPSILPNALGFLVEKEVTMLGKAVDNPERPFVAIIGGAKVSDKIAVVDNLLKKADKVIIGGGMAYTFMKAMGGEIGTSLLEEDKVALAKEYLEKAGDKLVLPVDNVCADKFAADANTQVCESGKIPADWMGLDIGPKTIELFTKTLQGAKTVVWNGPMGVFEMEPFAKGTLAVCTAISELPGATTVIGGGDSAAAAIQLGFADKFSHISTGGGASLEYMEGKELPGIAVISDK